jgi:hypothetical protein
LKRTHWRKKDEKLFRFPYVIGGIKIYVRSYHGYVFMIEGSDYLPTNNYSL